MSRKVAILQSNYIPWKGYFDIVNSVDLFIFHDDLQYTKNDWRNRNKIKTPAGTIWLTIPCGSDERRLICDVTLKDHRWQRDHWNKIDQNYRNTKHFDSYSAFLHEVYLRRQWERLSELNQYLIKHIAREFLGSRTDFDVSSRYDLERRKAGRVVELCVKAGATSYLSGPAARNYLSDKDFEGTGIELQWMDYSGYPEYHQLYPPFEHGVSVLDLLFNEGADAGRYMKSFADKNSRLAQAGSATSCPTNRN
jgi:hypothetical protein